MVGEVVTCTNLNIVWEKIGYEIKRVGLNHLLQTVAHKLTIPMSPRSVSAAADAAHGELLEVLDGV